LGSAASSHQSGLSDPQIAHIAYTAGQIDIEAARQALKKTRNPRVRDFATTMVRDHEAVNRQALALIEKLGVKPEANSTSANLSKVAAAKLHSLARLKGPAYDRAYVTNEVAYHHIVNGALSSALIPGAHNAELKALLETGLTLFQQHEAHAEHLAKQIR
jgi:putative membrane protein